jgi:hypothetical protein
MRKAGLLCSLALGVVVVFLGGWALTYPSPDPKSIQYVLWKADLYRLNFNEATGTMVGDPDRDKLVVGKTKAQLRSKFGSLLPPASASPVRMLCRAILPGVATPTKISSPSGKTPIPTSQS